MSDLSGAVRATVESEAGPVEVRLELHRFDRSLADVLHAVACASPGDRPGRTLRRHVEWTVG